MVILGSGVPVLAYTLQLLGINLFAPFSSIPVAMALAGIIMLLAMTQFRFIDIIPVAYDLIFKSVNGGIIVIDLKGRVAGLNRAAEQILDCREKDVLWKQMSEAFPNQQQIVRQFWDVMEMQTEIAFPESQRHYELQIAPLHSYHGELAGRLIMFYDITERKQIEQKNLELTMERGTRAVVEAIHQPHVARSAHTACYDAASSISAAQGVRRSALSTAGFARQADRPPDYHGREHVDAAALGGRKPGQPMRRECERYCYGGAIRN